MELEHLLQHSGWFLILQMMMCSLMVPTLVGRTDIYRSFVRMVASHIVSFGPFALLVYVLYEVSRRS